uniref:Uncharacterized protein n=1 Tax=Rhizophora mucronata TaxID=61149 RepID=A0A2P2P052_RHIMU
MPFYASSSREKGLTRLIGCLDILLICFEIP